MRHRKLRLALMVLLPVVLAVGWFVFPRWSADNWSWAAQSLQRKYRNKFGPDTHPWQAEGMAMEDRLALVADSIDLNWLTSERMDTLEGLVFLRGPELDRTYGEVLLREGKEEEAVAKIERMLQQQESPTDEDLLLLSTAYFRSGEVENCILDHNVDRCLFPIRGKGVYTLRSGPERAVGPLTTLLERDGDNLAARWLFNLVQMTLAGYPQDVPADWLIPPAALASTAEVPRFYDVARQLGIDDWRISGSSVLDDIDGDGYLDIVASSIGLEDPLALFLNDQRGGFVSAGPDWGLSGLFGGLNLTHVDYDNDGLLDLFVLRGAWMGTRGELPNSLLRNRGDRFEDVTEAVGLLRFAPTQVAVWADVNNDGLVDLFVGNEDASFNGRYPSELHLGRADGTFEDASSALPATATGFVKGATWGDYDGDGLMDLFISRTQQRNTLLHNEGVVDGRPSFRDATDEAGVSEPVDSFATWFFDYDNDGWQDLFVATYPSGFFEAALEPVVADVLGLETDSAGQLRLYRNDGAGGFEDVTQQTGLDRTTLAMGANFGDINNDGWLDVYLGTGAPPFHVLTPNVMFLSEGGEVFHDVSAVGGFGHLQKGHGISFGDIDNDGDEDIYAVMGGWWSADRFGNQMFLNPGNDNHWLTLRLEGRQSNRAAVGTRVRVVAVSPDGVPFEIHRVVGSGGSFGSSSFQQEIGLGSATEVERIEVTWPASGTVDVFEQVAVDRIYRVVEGEPELEPVDVDRVPLTPVDEPPSTHTGHME